MATDPRTGRPIGDHGTANDAIEFVLDEGDGDLGNMEAFLRAWREGDAAEEWPEFYTFLAQRGRTDRPAKRGLASPFLIFLAAFLALVALSDNARGREHEIATAIRASLGCAAPVRP